MTDKPRDFPVEIRKAAALPIKLVVDNTGAYCRHYPRHVRANTRSVVCGTCGAPLDAFDCLLEVARNHEHFEWNRRKAHADIKAAEARLKELERLEANARGRLRRLGVALPSKHVIDIKLRQRAELEGA